MGNYHYRLLTPLQKGEKIKLTFKLAQQQSGFGGFARDSLITDKATLLYSSNKFPHIGYVKQREISDNQTRRKYGLTDRAETETLKESLTRTGGNFSGNDDFAQFETIVSTSILFKWQYVQPKRNKKKISQYSFNSLKFDYDYNKGTIQSTRLNKNNTQTYTRNKQKVIP